jgi:predicted HAD superfamily hydrolase
MKELTKRIYNSYPKLTDDRINMIFTQAKKYEYVSFDVFDTLIKRDVDRPQRIFSIVEKIWNEEHPDAQIESFESERITAEKKANESYNDCPTIDQIYDELPGFPSEIKKLEIEVELQACVANYPVKKLYDLLLENGNKLVIISDMYLEKNTITKILKRNGYEGYCDLFVSQEYGANKKTGQLFKIFLDNHSVRPESVIHIGDSRKADIKGASVARVDSIKIPYYMGQVSPNLSIAATSELRDIYSFIDNHIDCQKGNYHKFGYSVVGLMLLGFCQWIEENVNHDKKILFMARDSKIVENAFNQLFPNLYTSSYFYASRKSVYLPLLYNVDDASEILNRLPLKSAFDTKYIISALGEKAENYPQFETRKMILPLSTDDREYLVEIISKVVDDKRQLADEQLRNLEGYVTQESEKFEIVLVDIGWAGTIQKFIDEILIKVGIETSSGLYLGLNKRSQQNQINAKGYYFDQKAHPDQIDKVRPYIALVETIFSDDIGTTIAYRESEEGYVAVFDEFEFLHDDNHRYINEIRDGALQFISDFSESVLWESRLKLNMDDAMLNIERVGINPTLSEVELLGDIQHSDQGKNYIARPSKFSSYLVNPKSLNYDFRQSRWKIGFLKRLFRIPFDYSKLYFSLASKRE